MCITLKMILFVFFSLFFLFFCFIFHFSHFAFDPAQSYSVLLLNRSILRFVCIWQQRLLQRPTSTRMPIQTKSSTSTSAPSTSVTPKLEIYTASKDKNEHNGPTSTFDDLLNSFQKESTTTTRRPQLTTFSDADDVAFLKGLVRIKSLFFSFLFLSFCLHFIFIQCVLNRLLTFRFNFSL